MSSPTFADAPWGRWEVLLDSQECKVKRISVQPGHRLSYQKHHHRAETWVVVAGKALVTLDGDTREYQTGDVIQIPLGAAHRVANPGTEPLLFIEIQRGDYFGEDDIIRLEDDYGREQK
ncbi:cupin domain-containing protein [bacterium]|nr:cupin domain-containing protein [bacterium]